MTGTTRLRAACDTCHQLKVRCSGSMPCEGCADSGSSCFYSMSSRLGRPPGVIKKNIFVQQPKQQAALAESAFSSKPTAPPSKKSTKTTQPKGMLVRTAGREKTASPRNHWSQNGSPISRPMRPQNSQSPAQSLIQPHVQQHTQPHTETQTDASLFSWPPLTQQSPQLLTQTTQSVGSDDSSVNPVILGSSHSMPCLDDSNSHNYSESTGGALRSQMPLGLSDTLRLLEDLLECRRSILDHSPQTSDFELALPTPTSSVSLLTPVDHSWNVFPGLDGAAVDTSFESPPTDTSQDGNEHCECLQQHTELLCALKVPESTRSISRSWPTLDRSLFHIQEALRVWRSLIKCPTCAHNDDQEVLILALMCICAVLTQLRHVSWRDGAAGSLDSRNDNKHLESRPATSRSRHLSSESQDSMPDFPGIDCNNGLQMQIGGFEVTGHDKSVLLQALRSNILRKIAAVLMLLKKILERKKSIEKASGSLFLPAESRGNLGGGQRQVSRHGTSSLVVEQMMQDTTSAVERLMGDLKPLDM